MLTKFKLLIFTSLALSVFSPIQASFLGPNPGRTALILGAGAVCLTVQALAIVYVYSKWFKSLQQTWSNNYCGAAAIKELQKTWYRNS